MDRIGVFDSGIGGLTTLAEIVNHRNGGDYVYYADCENSPFGTKGDAELYAIGKRAVEKLVSYGCNHVVLGCNTMTAVAKRRLVEEFPYINIIGTEPALLPAVRECTSVALLATPSTVASRRVQDLLLECRGQVACYPNPNLAGIIEGVAPDYCIMKKYLLSTCSYLVDYDALVLGCTHFVHVKEVFQECFPRIKIFDGNEGVARRVGSFVPKESGLLTLQIHTNPTDREDRYKKIFDKIYKNLKMGIEK